MDMLVPSWYSEFWCENFAKSKKYREAVKFVVLHKKCVFY